MEGQVAPSGLAYEHARIPSSSTTTSRPIGWGLDIEVPDDGPPGPLIGTPTSIGDLVVVVLANVLICGAVVVTIYILW